MESPKGAIRPSVTWGRQAVRIATDLSLTVVTSHFGGYTPAMTLPMQDLIGDLETRINTMVERVRGAELDLYYAEVLDFEQAIDKLYDAIYFVGDQVATEAVASR
jgi:hypothetical protein